MNLERTVGIKSAAYLTVWAQDIVWILLCKLGGDDLGNKQQDIPLRSWWTKKSTKKTDLHLSVGQEEWLNMLHFANKFAISPW